MNIECTFCGEKLKKPGALMFAPPKVGLSKKYHLCVKCYELAIHCLDKFSR